MKKKIMLVGIFIVFMLVTISFATAVNNRNTEKKESPLYRVRTRQSIGEKISNIVNNIKTKFLEERIFRLPIKIYKNFEISGAVTSGSATIIDPKLGNICYVTACKGKFCE